MARKPRNNPTSPDGKPAAKSRNQQDSSLSAVDDPLISGDSGSKKRVEADEAQVDEAGQIDKKPPSVDLLH